MNEITFDIESDGLNAWYGNKITCICAKCSDGDLFIGSLKDLTEKELIEGFIIWLEGKKDFVLVSHSGKGFDVPFICARANLNLLPTPMALLRAKHHDLQDIANYRISLDNMAKLLKCEVKSGNGLQAIKFYEQGNWKDLIDYCLQDVNVIEQVYQKYQNLK